LHKFHHRLTKLSAVPILMSSQRQGEMQWEERAAKTGGSNVGDCGFGFDLRRRFCLRLWCEGMALAQANRQNIVSTRPILPWQQERDEVGRRPNGGILRLACLPDDLRGMIEITMCG
jgi:hypothetical protein